MLSVSFLIVMQNVVILGVVMLSVVAPVTGLAFTIQLKQNLRNVLFKLILAQAHAYFNFFFANFYLRESNPRSKDYGSIVLPPRYDIS
jgi:hypothetical protein